MEEIWKDIKGFEGLYQVSNLGRVRSLNYKRTGEMRVLQQCKHRCGYLQVALHKNNKQKNYLVHRLIAEAFIPNPYGLPCVNHRDECKTNNIATNLEWCSSYYNINYGTRNERISKRVYQYTLDGSFVRSYYSTHEAARQNGISQGNIAGCCRGAYGCKSARGYIWSFNPPTDITPRSLW